MHMGLNSASVGMIWKAQNFKVKILCRIYGIANILFICEKRDFNVQLYLVTIWKKPYVSLWAHVSETFKQIDKSSCEKNHGSKEYYGI